MYSLLIAIIYLTFISLGLPDSLLGSGWPSMYAQLGVPVSYAGVVSMLIAGSTIVSSLMSDRLTLRLGTGRVTLISVAVSSAALLGFGFSRRFWQLCLLAVPYGLSAGAIDAAINNYVALHYSSRLMSWLHCFWGVGTIISPYIMSACLTDSLGWQMGYRSVALLQAGVALVLLFSLPLWKKRTAPAGDGQGAKPRPLKQVLAIPGAKCVLLAFFGYCALESTTGLWAASYLVLHRGIQPDTAARFASLFYIGITAGRFLCGFVADKVGDRGLIRCGIGIIIAGVLTMWLPLGNAAALAGLVVIGLGCAPVYPSVIHSTPENFGPENSQAIIGVQMASAYTGSTLMPPLFGLAAQYLSPALLPLLLFLLAALMLTMTELMNRARKAA